MANDASGTAAITVAVRVRPFFEAAVDSTGDVGLRRIVQVVDDRILVFDPVDPNSRNQTRTYNHGSRRHKEIRYGFDRVFNETATQQEVYEGTAQPLIDGVLNGYNATVFAYGATGCGKTHTITGTPQDPGIIFLTMRELFHRIDNASSEQLVDSSLSYLEVYNETIRDLLCPSPSNQSLDVREDDGSNRVVVAGLSEHRPKNVDDVMQMLIKGNENRTRAPTEANAVSSRSHAVLQIHIRQRDRAAGVNASVKMATLSIIDLAGSERASVTKNKGERLLEGANINRSLLALGNCINALCSERPNHIPYRDSKLTRLLKYSLGGNCRVVMITNISPSSFHYDETHNTLKYANRAKNIKTKVEQNSIDVTAHLAQYPKIISELKAEVEVLRQQLGKASRDSSGEENGKEPGIRTDIFEMIMRKVQRIFDKMAIKESERCEALAEVEKNERKLSILKAITTILDQNAANEDSLSLCRQQITSVIEATHATNVGLRHNANQARLGILRHNAEVDKIERGGGGQKLSTEQRETLRVEIQLLKLSAQNALLMKQVEAYQGALEDQSRTVVEIVAKNAQIISDLMRITHTARDSDMIGEEVVALVEEVAQNASGDLTGLAGQNTEAPTVDLDWDTSSETSELSDVESSDSEVENSDGEESGRLRRAKRRNSYLHKEMEEVARSFTPAPQTPAEEPSQHTPDRDAGHAVTPATAIKLLPSKQYVDDVDATPQAHKRGGSPSLDSTAKKVRGRGDTKPERDIRSTSTTPTRLHSKLPEAFDDDVTPLARPKRSILTPAEFGKPPPPPAFRTDKMDSLGADEPDHHITNESHQHTGGPIRTSPHRRSRRRARQSLIPVMKTAGRRESMLPLPAGILGREGVDNDARRVTSSCPSDKFPPGPMAPSPTATTSSIGCSPGNKANRASDTSSNASPSTRSRNIIKARKTPPRTSIEDEGKENSSQSTRRSTRNKPSRISFAPSPTTPRPTDILTASSNTRRRRTMIVPPSNIQTRSSTRRKASGDGSRSPSSGEENGVKPKWK
ncbi:uncharacterized protein SPPG_06224 [Spizellomyces punctatus DAOM BR117]|uniref:Kinesin motor domain-containing protein n=1 Tax=Spizellomyces punctatus (strain DAOM BR117) TaxID=645134 RepID=A0A0L0HC72_SPIPD|nr:uncharacterized protein SPPG_06224 [Spizellomyces punctatus DAOM BR117]KNC98531.1 hypothetical protein SPPG_06224 [Spizellomyces punctatus DAOM BR117]|eukprot:XP_016606571.1 hypothetical protein SPPG_06224 [Spizellomyces punctatus DAOM BR117]